MKLGDKVRVRLTAVEYPGRTATVLAAGAPISRTDSRFPAWVRPGVSVAIA